MYDQIIKYFKCLKDYGIFVYAHDGYPFLVNDNCNPRVFLLAEPLVKFALEI